MPSGLPGDGYIYNGVTQGAEDWAKTMANGKIADSIVKTNPEMLNALGMDPDQFAGMSAASKTATVTGYFQAQGAKQQAAKTAAMLQDYASQAQERSSIANWRSAQANRATQQDSEDAATGQAVQRFWNAPPVSAVAGYPGGATDPTAQMMSATDPGAASAGAAPSYQDRMAYAMNAPGLGGRSALNLAKVLQTGGYGGSTAPVTTPGPYPGVSLVTDPRGGGVHVVTDPSLGVQPLTDPTTGDIVPGGYVTRGGVRFAPTQKQPDDSLVESRNQAALTSWHKRFDPVQTQLEYAQGKVSDPNAAPADVKKYTPMVQTLTKQRDAIIGERPKLESLAGGNTKLDASARGNTKLSGGSAAPKIAQPATQEEFDALPSGAQFVNPSDGKILTKK